MHIENTQSQMRKGILEYCILSIISRGPVYATDILNELKSAHLIVVEGTLYPLLTRMKNAGLLQYEWKESVQGPPRKYFSLTISGTIFLQQLHQTWAELSHSVNIATSKPS